jgi:hypothetical protein
MDKWSRHGGQVLNTRNLSAMSPTKLHFRMLSGVDDYRWKESITVGTSGAKRRPLHAIIGRRRAPRIVGLG